MPSLEADLDCYGCGTPTSHLQLNSQLHYKPSLQPIPIPSSLYPNPLQHLTRIKQVYEFPPMVTHKIVQRPDTGLQDKPRQKKKLWGMLVIKTSAPACRKFRNMKKLTCKTRASQLNLYPMASHYGSQIQSY